MDNIPYKLAAIGKIVLSYCKKTLLACTISVHNSLSYNNLQHISQVVVYNVSPQIKKYTTNKQNKIYLIGMNTENMYQ